MSCRKCNGRVFVDRVFSERRHIELFCIECGKRWMLDKHKTKLADWLVRFETIRENSISLRM